MLRKKPQSAALDAGFRSGRERENLTSGHKPGGLESLRKAFLPGPFADIQGWHDARTLLADVVFLSLSFAAIEQLAPWLSFLSAAAPVLQAREPWFAADLRLLLVYGALITLLGHTEGLYGNRIRPPEEEKIILGKTVMWATLLLIAAMPHLHAPGVSIKTLSATAVVGYLCLLSWRECRRRLAARRIASGRPDRNVLIVGAGNLGRALAAAVQHDYRGGRAVLGFLDDGEFLGGDVLGRVADLTRVARAEFVDEVVVAIPSQPELSRRVIREALRNRLDVSVVPDVFGYEPSAPLMENLRGLPVFRLHEERILESGLFVKRMVDVVLSAAGLLIAAPLLAAIAVIIQLDSPGPVLYSAPRVGRKGRRFLCYKFRTMVTDADRQKEKLRGCNDRAGPFFKMAADPRVTRVGRFLRRYSVDELPQLWNVLRGEMSLVGPRPHPIDDFQRYRLDHLRRLDVTPGITGLWQVTARRDPSFQRNMALDLEYIEHWSLWMDLRILWRTVGVVLQGNGS